MRFIYLFALLQSLICFNNPLNASKLSHITNELLSLPLLRKGSNLSLEIDRIYGSPFFSVQKKYGVSLAYKRNYSSQPLTIPSPFPVIKMFVADHLSEEMDKLRLKCFPGDQSFHTSRDVFDHTSKHIIARTKGDVAAYGRLTPGPNSVFEAWSHGRAELPTGREVVDLGRVLVSPPFRGSLLYEAIVLKGLQWAEEQNFKYVVGAFGVERYVGKRLLNLGFKISGRPVYTDESNGRRTFVQPIIYEIKSGKDDWDNLIKYHLNISFNKSLTLSNSLLFQTVEGSAFKENKNLMQEMRELCAPSYEDPSSVLQREVEHCNKIYLARHLDGQLASFFMVSWEELELKGKIIPSVYLGLGTTSQSTKNSGIVRKLFRNFIREAQAWEQANAQRLICWYTTPTPFIFHAVNVCFTDNQLSEDGSYTDEAKDCILAIRKKMNWELQAGGHPFVLKGVAEGTRYSQFERERIANICRLKNFTFFNDMGVDETQGDRILRICRIPLSESKSKL